MQENSINITDTTTKINCPVGSKIKFKNINSFNKEKCGEVDIAKKFKEKCEGMGACDITSSTIGCTGYNLDLAYACINDIGQNLMGSGDVNTSIEQNTNSVNKKKNRFNYEIAKQRHNRLITLMREAEVDGMSSDKSMNLIKNQEDDETSMSNFNSINTSTNGTDVKNISSSETTEEQYNDKQLDKGLLINLWTTYKFLILTTGAIIVLLVIVYLLFKYVFKSSNKQLPNFELPDNKLLNVIKYKNRIDTISPEPKTIKIENVPKIDNVDTINNPLKLSATPETIEKSNIKRNFMFGNSKKNEVVFDIISPFGGSALSKFKI
jgi:hypothetical protein